MTATLCSAVTTVLIASDEASQVDNFGMVVLAIVVVCVVLAVAVSGGGSAPPPRPSSRNEGSFRPLSPKIQPKERRQTKTRVRQDTLKTNAEVVRGRKSKAQVDWLTGEKKRG